MLLLDLTSKAYKTFGIESAVQVDVVYPNELCRHRYQLQLLGKKYLDS